MNLRIVFIGCVTFSRLTLLKLLELRADVVGIVTKDHSSFNSDFEDLAPIANANSIPFKYVKDINHINNIAWINNCKPDVIFCFGWSSLIKTEILSIPPLGVIGYHPSLLPYNRGRHPIIWAKVLGLEKTGSTFFFMDEGADTGDILSQREVQINFADSASDLYQRIISTALDQMIDFFPNLITRTFKKAKQDNSDGNSWRKRSPVDGQIDFRMTTAAICNLVRGLGRPYPGAHCNFAGTIYKIWSVEPGNVRKPNLEPGKLIEQKDCVLEVITGDGSILLIDHEIQPIPATGSYFS